MDNKNLINVTAYPLWQQFVDSKRYWIGGRMVDESCIDRPTIIKDVTLEPNGEDSSMLSFIGEDYTCAFDVRYGHVQTSPRRMTRWLCFGTTFGVTFYIRRKDQ